jgi:hypothetical protein
MSLRQGVARQVAAFSEAVRQVLPPEKLLAFTTSELLENVCGESVHWDSSTVRECIVRSCHHPRLSSWMPLPLLPPRYRHANRFDTTLLAHRSLGKVTPVTTHSTIGSYVRWKAWTQLLARHSSSL